MNPSCHLCVHNHLLVGPILSQMNPFHTFPSCFFKILLILSSHPGVHKSWVQGRSGDWLLQWCLIFLLYFTTLKEEHFISLSFTWPTVNRYPHQKHVYMFLPYEVNIQSLHSQLCQYTYLCNSLSSPICNILYFPLPLFFLHPNIFLEEFVPKHL